MKLAIEEAIKSKNRNEVPVGSIIINEKNKIISSNGNRISKIEMHKIFFIVPKD